jgi:hypothetical protein
MFHHSGPPVLAHIREANILAGKLAVDLSHTEIGKIVEEIYLQAGHREYIDALSARKLYDGIPSSQHDHWDDISSALALAPVVRTVCVLRKQEPVDPQLQEALGRYMSEMAEKILGRRPITGSNKDSHQVEQQSTSSSADESHLPENQEQAPDT